MVGLLESVVVVVVVGDSLVLPLALPANVLAVDCTDAATETSAFNLLLDWLLHALNTRLVTMKKRKIEENREGMKYKPVEPPPSLGPFFAGQH